MARNRRPSLYLFPAILLALIFVIVPGLPFDILPDNVREVWDGLVAPIRNPVTHFWWGYIKGATQQPLFNLVSYLTQVAILVTPWVIIRLLWIRRQRAAGRFR
jgi:hypothetical protein